MFQIIVLHVKRVHIPLAKVLMCHVLNVARDRIILQKVLAPQQHVNSVAWGHSAQPRKQHQVVRVYYVAEVHTT